MGYEETHVHWYRRANEDALQAVQLDHTNLRSVAAWIRRNRGAVAGMRLVETGNLTGRGLFLGDLHGIWFGGLGDWVVRFGDLDFQVMTNTDFEGAYFHVPAPTSSADQWAGRYSPASW